MVGIEAAGQLFVAFDRRRLRRLAVLLLRRLLQMEAVGTANGCRRVVRRLNAFGELTHFADVLFSLHCPNERTDERTNERKDKTIGPVSHRWICGRFRLCRKVCKERRLCVVCVLDHRNGYRSGLEAGRINRGNRYWFKNTAIYKVYVFHISQTFVFTASYVKP